MRDKICGQGIIYCGDNPIRTDGAVWLNTHIGGVSVGRKVAANLFDMDDGLVTMLWRR